MMKLDLALRGMYVKRWTIVGVDRGQSVNEHAYNVWLIADAIWQAFGPYMDSDQDSAFMRVVLTHDLHEVLLGDVPSTAKGYLNAKDLDRAQVQVRLEMGLPAIAAGSGAWFIMKLADTLEALFYCFNHLKLGAADGVDAHVRHNYRKILAAARRAWPQLPWDRVQDVVRAMCRNDDWSEYVQRGMEGNTATQVPTAPLAITARAPEVTAPPPAAPEPREEAWREVATAIPPRAVQDSTRPAAPAPVPPGQTDWTDILGRAQQAVRDRPAGYGSPYDNYSRLAGMVNSMFRHKLREPLAPSDCALIMAALKIARQAHRSQPDNMVDLAGYADVVGQIEAEVASDKVHHHGV